MGCHIGPTGCPVGGVLPLCRGEVGIFYCSSRQGSEEDEVEQNGRYVVMDTHASSTTWW